MLDNQKFGKRLVHAGYITQAKLDEVLRQNQVPEGRLGELLVRLGYVTESTVLHFLAAEFRTRYVSTERLAKAKIPQHVLDLLPIHIAERYNLVPVLYDAENNALSIVTSDPQNEASLREVHMLVRVRELRVYVALHSAVQAAIRKHYRGEADAFAQVPQGSDAPPPEPSYPPSEPYYHPPEYGPPPSGHGTLLPTHSPDYMSAPQGHFYGHPQEFYDPNRYNPNAPQPYDRSSSPYAYSSTPYDPPAAPSYIPPPSSAVPPYQEPYPTDYDDDDVTRLHTGHYNPGQPYNDGVEPPQGDVYSDQTAYGFRPQVLPAAALSLPGIVPLNALALLKHLIQRIQPHDPLLRQRRAWQEPILRLCLKRTPLTPSEKEAIWLAFFVYLLERPRDLKTPLELLKHPHELPSHQEHFTRFLESLQPFGLPPPVIALFENLYERADGLGFPKGRPSQEIPLGARWLALLDSADPLRLDPKTASTSPLLDALKAHQDEIFDPQLLQLFEKEHRRLEDFHQGKIPRVLFLDAEEPFVTEMEQLLLDRGWWVQTLAKPSDATPLLREQNFDLLILELETPGLGDGFDFVRKLKDDFPKGPEILFLTRREQPESFEQEMALGLDYLVKSLNPGLIVAKINRSIQELQRKKKDQLPKPTQKGALSGSLEQLGLPELLQVLSQGRRTGRLTITCDEGTGAVFLDQGSVVNAVFEHRKGKDAFYVLLAWERGDFRFEPDLLASERLIQAHLDGLILDGLRMIDEAKHGSGRHESESSDLGDAFNDPSTPASKSGDHFPAQSFHTAPPAPPPKPASSGGLEIKPPPPASPKKGPPPSTPPTSLAPKSKSEIQGLFQDLREDDLDDVFSTTFTSEDRAAERLKKT